jgi:hypothetical protein
MALLRNVFMRDGIEHLRYLRVISPRQYSRACEVWFRSKKVKWPENIREQCA